MANTTSNNGHVIARLPTQMIRFGCLYGVGMSFVFIKYGEEGAWDMAIEHVKLTLKCNYEG